LAQRLLCHWSGRGILMRFRFWLQLCALTAAIGLAAPASAGTILDCGPNGAQCSVTLSIDGTQVANGNYEIDPSTGDLIWPGMLSGSLGDSTLSVMNVTGNADPILGFAVASNTGAVGSAFSITFTLPIALSGPIDAAAQVSYSLTGTSAAGAQIAPLFAKVLIAQEVDTSIGGLTPLNKGVDVGNTFFCTPGPCNSTSPTYAATNQFVGNLAYDLMSATLAYSLSANSNVGISGFVQQVPVPEPGTAALLAFGMLAIAATRRSRS
jgi:hypothetical protein